MHPPPTSGIVSTAAASAVPALSPTAEHREGKPNAVANARQQQVDKDYHRRVKELDSGFGGDLSDGFEAELSSYGKRALQEEKPPEAGGRCLRGDTR